MARNVIAKDLEVLEQWLLKFDLKIVKKRNMGIGVEGGKLNIRQAILDVSYTHLKRSQMLLLKIMIIPQS